MPNEYSEQELQKRIGYQFKNKDFLTQALTHSSYANEQRINKKGDYERLEFLGDAILELVSSDFLFRTYPQMPEGQMTKMRSSMVCEPSLAFCARDLELGEFIKLGKGEENGGGRKRPSITSDVMEAVIGAIYLDSGLEDAKAFIHRFILSDLENKQLFYDSKTRLQELVQAKYRTNVTYELVGESGPEHDKMFSVKVLVNEKTISSGIGHTKKAAEQQAAYDAIVKIKNED